MATPEQLIALGMVPSEAIRLGMRSTVVVLDVINKQFRKNPGESVFIRLFSAPFTSMRLPPREDCDIGDVIETYGAALVIQAFPGDHIIDNASLTNPYKIFRKVAYNTWAARGILV